MRERWGWLEARRHNDLSSMTWSSLCVKLETLLSATPIKNNAAAQFDYTYFGCAEPRRRQTRGEERERPPRVFIIVTTVALISINLCLIIITLELITIPSALVRKNISLSQSAVCACGNWERWLLARQSILGVSSKSKPLFLISSHRALLMTNLFWTIK